MSVALSETQVSNDFYHRRKFITDLTERKERYAQYYEKTPLHTKTIFYESMGGMRMMDNPYALFKEIYRDKRFKNYQHVWSVAHISTVPKEFRTKKNILFVTRNTDSYLRNLASAGYIICNSVLPDYFVRRPHQKYLNTWHGIAYKGIGRNADFSPLGPSGTVSNMLQATHILSPCDFMTQRQLYGFSMHGVYAGQMAEAGYPRIDMTLNLSNETKKNLWNDLGINPKKKTILYAPTWRGEGFDTKQLASDMSELGSLDANIIFMGHHLMLKHVKGVDFGNITIAPEDTNTNNLLGAVDILITDYSSIFFDFLVTGRPIIHYMYDYNEYKSTRGLNLEPDELPGIIAYTDTDMLKAVRSLIAAPYGPTKKYLAARERFCPHEDGMASKKVADWFLSEDVSGVKIIEKSRKKTVVFWGGDLKETKEGIDYLRSVKSYTESNKEIVSLVIDRSVAKKNQIMEIINDLGLKVTVITRTPEAMVATWLEKLVKHAIERGIPLDKLPFIRRYYRGMYQREYRKVFGDAVFEEIVLNKQCNRFWQELARCAYKHGR